MLVLGSGARMLTGVSSGRPERWDCLARGHHAKRPSAPAAEGSKRELYVTTLVRALSSVCCQAQAWVPEPVLFPHGCLFLASSHNRSPDQGWSWRLLAAASGVDPTQCKIRATLWPMSKLCGIGCRRGK